MNRVASILETLETGLVWANRAVLVAMMMLMAALVFTNVIFRYVIGDSLNWSEEVARFLMVWITYLGAGLAMREGQHVAIEFTQSMLPRRYQPWIRGLVAVTVIGFLAILTVVGFQFSEFTWRQRSAVMQWRMGAVYLAVPIGALLFAVHFLAIARQWIFASPGYEDPEENDPAPGEGGEGGTAVAP